MRRMTPNVSRANAVCATVVLALFARGKTAPAIDEAQRAVDAVRAAAALDASDKRALDALQRGIDARRGMLEAGRELVSSLDERYQGSSALARLGDNLALFEGSVSAAVTTLNMTDDIDEIDKDQLKFCVDYAQEFMDEAARQLAAAKLEAKEDLSALDRHMSNAEALLDQLKQYQAAVDNGDADATEALAESFNKAMDAYLGSAQELPAGTTDASELPEDVKSHIQDYLDARERAVSAAKDLRSYDNADVSALSERSDLL